MSKQKEPDMLKETLEQLATITVTFICLGNICRSPLAAAIFSAYVTQYYPRRSFRVVSAATGSHTIGEPADERSIQMALTKESTALSGVHARIKSHVAQTVSPEMLIHSHYLFVMDHENYANVMKKWKAMLLAQPCLAQTPIENRLFYFGNFAAIDNDKIRISRESNINIIKDPWYGSTKDFEIVYDQCLAASKGFLNSTVYHDHCGK